MSTPTGPLRGIKIIDLSTAIAAPFAVAMLADQGADVIKVESPGFGDIARYIGASRNGMGAMFQMSNRGKRGMALNLKEERGIEILKSLAEDADVVIHNFRVGVVERLGISYADLSSNNPNLIYCSVYGYGHTGPYAHKRAYDNVIQCFSGVAHTQADVDTGEPVQNYQAIADKLTSMNAAQAITAALFARERGHGGQHVRLSMVDSVIAFLWMDASGMATFLEDGAIAGPQVAKGNKLIQFRNGWGAAAPAADAEFFGLCRAFGVDANDPRVATAMDRMVNTDYVKELMQQVWAAARNMDADEALALMDAEDVPCAKVMALEELPEHPQIKANNTFVESLHPVAGRIQQPRPAPEFEKTPAQAGAPAPTIGQHSDEILRELGLSDQVAELRDTKIIA
ncbi:MAG: CaiB/BaiF CoA transferase family protein [Pseudomonadales bacterium]